MVILYIIFLCLGFLIGLGFGLYFYNHILKFKGSSIDKLTEQDESLESNKEKLRNIKLDSSDEESEEEEEEDEDGEHQETEEQKKIEERPILEKIEEIPEKEESKK